MATASRHVADVNQAVQSELSSLMSRLEPLAGAWKGQRGGELPAASGAVERERTQAQRRARRHLDGDRDVGPDLPDGGRDAAVFVLQHLQRAG
jgi:hypothetical protein